MLVKKKKNYNKIFWNYGQLLICIDIFIVNKKKHEKQKERFGFVARREYP